ncbi:YciI family protein [Myxococcus sp. K38C18041901]|uniref:YciI family protein n=1 Tax=Myxococcus guangdongensis TaxID=2906760 RepID=UPI0020A779CC|nr:YciI family protein [Myxococcus guangdongensis]MCP3061963.1 YciI family protein [Myxococcus guangdongensis]
MLHVLCLEYRLSEAAAAPHVSDHVRFLERHHRSGTFILSGQTVPTALGGVILARGVDRVTVERIAAEDPFVLAGVARYTLLTVDPGRLHPALGALLAVDASRERSPAPGDEGAPQS